MVQQPPMYLYVPPATPRTGASTAAATTPAHGRCTSCRKRWVAGALRTSAIGKGHRCKRQGPRPRQGQASTTTEAATAQPRCARVPRAARCGPRSRPAAAVRSPAGPHRQPTAAPRGGLLSFWRSGVQLPAATREQALQRRARARLDQHLHALDAGHARHRRRHRRIDHHARQTPAARPRLRPRRAGSSGRLRASWLRRAAAPGSRTAAAPRLSRSRSWLGGKGREVVRAPARRTAGGAGARSGPTSRWRAPCAASRPARPAACISSANRRSGARKSLANRPLSGLTAATSVMRRKSWPLATICVPTSTSTSPACTAPSCASSAPLRRVLSASMRAMRAPGSSVRQLLFEPLGAAADRRGCRGCRTRGRRAARAR